MKDLTPRPMPTITLPAGEPIPVLGQGAWHMGEDARRRRQEIDALRLGLDLGMTLIDTAELYGTGASEELVGEAIADRRDDVFLVTKVLPANASMRSMTAACDHSLRRLGTDRIDLYLLHWREKVSLEELVGGFTALVEAGKIRYWGVSNFDIADMQELLSVQGGEDVQANQVLYNLTRRGIEYDLLPWCRSKRIPIMAYSPIEQGRLLDDATLLRIAALHGATPAQIALAWVTRHDGVCTIPKAGTPEHVRENRAALEVALTEQDLAELERDFPPPARRRRLELL